MIWSSTSNWHSLMLPSPFVNNTQLIYNTLLMACRRKGLLPGSPLFLLSSMGLFCTKMISLMLFFAMVGLLLGFHLTVFVVVTPHAFSPSSLTTSVTLLHHFCLKLVMMLTLNIIFSHFLGRILGTGLQFVMMIPILISVLLVFGVIAINMLFLMFVCSTPLLHLIGHLQ